MLYVSEELGFCVKVSFLIVINYWNCMRCSKIFYCSSSNKSCSLLSTLCNTVDFIFLRKVVYLLQFLKLYNGTGISKELLGDK